MVKVALGLVTLMGRVLRDILDHRLGRILKRDLSCSSRISLGLTFSIDHCGII
jgi:hypothetical protein